jgi:hypothetical protein
MACTAAAAKAAVGKESCFVSSSWKGWSPAAGGDALYLRVNINDIYRVELTPGSHARRGAGDFLVNQLRGSAWICSPLDLDLAISDDMGFHRPLIATGLRKLTAAEVAVIPRKELP